MIRWILQHPFRHACLWVYVSLWTWFQDIRHEMEGEQ